MPVNDPVRRSALLVITVSLAVSLVACNDPHPSRLDASAPSATTAPTPPPSPSVTATATPEMRDPADHATARDSGLPICRVMSSEGGPSATADATSWLDVAAKASFSVRTLDTGRELRFEGPGRVRACGDDVALVAEGSAVGLPGTGEAPGAEQWVATACGAARWASGVHRFASARDRCRLQSSTGTLELYSADDMTFDEVAVDGGAPLAASSDAGAADAGAAKNAWRRIDGRRAFEARARGPLDSAASVKASLTACERAAITVQRLATGMTGGDAGDAGDIGTMAADSVMARGIARAACAVAAVRVALAGSKPDDLTRLATLNSRWRAPR